MEQADVLFGAADLFIEEVLLEIAVNPMGETAANPAFSPDSCVRDNVTGIDLVGFDLQGVGIV